MPLSALLIVNGRVHHAPVPVVPQSLLPTPVTPAPARHPSSYGVDAAFMLLQLHGSGIHAVWSGLAGPTVPGWWG